MHLLVVRLFVESILRYGLPPSFQAAVLRPQDKTENRLRAELDSSFGGGELSRITLFRTAVVHAQATSTCTSQLKLLRQGEFEH